MNKKVPIRKIIWIALGIVVLLGAGLATIQVYQAVRKFSVEDQIHGIFFPVVAALHQFQEEAGSAPQDLTQLTPKYLPAIPQSDLIDEVTYTRSADGKNWKLLLHSKALSPPRTYDARSKQDYTTEETSRIILTYHSVWTVLRE